MVFMEINTAMDNLVPVNCLNACSTPIYAGGFLPYGTIFACNTVPYSDTGTAYPLYIRL